MAEQQVALQQKKELTPAEERTEAGRFFSPYTDIHETAAAVVVTMEMPGVDKSAVDIRLDKGVLTIKGTVNPGSYEAWRPIYSEYNVGNFIRTFTVSTKIDSAIPEALSRMHSSMSVMIVSFDRSSSSTEFAPDTRSTIGVATVLATLRAGLSSLPYERRRAYRAFNYELSMETWKLTTAMSMRELRQAL